MYSSGTLLRVLVVLALIWIACAIMGGSPYPWYGNWLFVHAGPHSDLRVYFESSRWIIEGGKLYKDAPSEYPPLANVVFAVWRWLGNLVYPGFTGFIYTWVISSSLIYLWASPPRRGGDDNLCRIHLGRTCSPLFCIE